MKKRTKKLLSLDLTDTAPRLRQLPTQRPLVSAAAALVYVALPGISYRRMPLSSGVWPIEKLSELARRMIVANEADGAIVSSTMVEARPGKENNAGHVVERLRDWQLRVSNFYKFVENTLGRKFHYDRTEKQRSAEEPVQQAKLPESQIPSLDILRIQDLNGLTRASIMPRGLWIIGANGRLDLRVHNLKGNRQKQYYLIDKSIPLSGAENASWFIIDPLDRLEQTPLTAQVLRELIPV